LTRYINIQGHNEINGYKFIYKIYDILFSCNEFKDDLDDLNGYLSAEAIKELE